MRRNGPCVPTLTVWEPTAAQRWPAGGEAASAPGRFFFQAEDGIRDLIVTGVQTCALPIWPAAMLSVLMALCPLTLEAAWAQEPAPPRPSDSQQTAPARALPRPEQLEPAVDKIGRASCRERV